MLITAILVGLVIPAKALNNGNLSRFPEYILESGLTSVQKHQLLTFTLEVARETTVGFPPTREDFFSACGQANAARLSAMHSPPDFCKPMCLLLKHNRLINLHLQVNEGKYCPVTTFFRFDQTPLNRASLD